MAEVRSGQLRYRPRGEPPPAALLRLVANLIGLEVDRAKAPERATEAAVGRLPPGPARPQASPTARTSSPAPSELGCDLSAGASVIVVRARPQHAEEGDWRARVLTVAERGARGVERASLAALAHGRLDAPRAGAQRGRRRALERELVILAPAADAAAAKRIAAAVAARARGGPARASR